jgi:hypothetical protein
MRGKALRVLPFGLFDASLPPAESRIESGFVQYGAALAAEIVAAEGPICRDAPAAPCVIGSGGGVAVRVGYRDHGPWYFGGAYEFSKQDAHKALVVPILQQLRAETRYVFSTTTFIAPFAAGALGGALYGSEWSAATFGGVASLGIGAELSLSRTSLLVFSLSYRGLVLKRWTDPAGEDRRTGLTSLVAVELGFEQRTSTY